MARAVIRRAERRVVSHLRSSGIDDSRVVVYLNRLADFVFMLARAEEGSSALWHEQQG
jgi:cob(I)alamin adenosyltransferase